MKIRTANELKELNAALDKCKNPVWLMGPNDEAFNMMDEEEYIEGIIKLAEDHDNRITRHPGQSGPFLVSQLNCLPLEEYPPIYKYIYAKRPPHWTFNVSTAVFFARFMLYSGQESP